MEEIVKSITGPTLAWGWMAGLNAQNIKMENPIYDISENSMASQDAVQNVKDLLEDDGANIVTGVTNYHLQNETNHCHSFATVSGLRNALRKIVEDFSENKRSRETKRSSEKSFGNRVEVSGCNVCRKGFNTCAGRQLLADPCLSV